MVWQGSRAEIDGDGKPEYGTLIVENGIFIEVSPSD